MSAELDHLLRHPALRGVPVVLVLTKSDEPCRMEPSFLLDAIQFDDLAEDFPTLSLLCGSLFDKSFVLSILSKCTQLAT